MATAKRIERPGLTDAEAASRLAEVGRNEVPVPPGPGIVHDVLEQLRDPMVVVLLLAAVLTTLTGDHPDTVVILLVVAFDATVGVVQHRRAERAVAALQDLAPRRVSVRRGGRPLVVDAAEVVPDDCLLLAGGDVVCADGVVEVAEALTLDESAMTGESVPVVHGPGDPLAAGTLVVRGRGELRVTATGASSGLGRLAHLVHDGRVRATPLQRRMRRLSLVLVVGTLALTAVVVVAGLLRGEGLVEMLVVGASLAVAAVPESLPAVLTVALAFGAHRMAARQAVVRRLAAVETLGSVTVIATDKTGTLTHGSLSVTSTWSPDGDEATLLRDLVLCNDAAASGVDGRHQGDPLEVALLDHAGRRGIEAAVVRETWPRTGEVPFDATTQRMTTVHEDVDRSLVVVKGAPERVLPLVRGPVRQAEECAAAWAGDGCRVLAVAHDAGNGLHLSGLVAFTDPPRSAAAAVVARCREAGIRVVLVTGDHLLTARSVARQVGIPDVPADDPGRPARASVFARVRPEQKLDLVDALHAEGEVVAMLGDGVNDAPALRRADIGVAAGAGGTEVARQAADVVLLDDDLSTVVAAIEEGRRIFDNLRAFLVYAVAGGLSEVAVMLLGPFAGMLLPLLPSQILWINLLTHGLTGLAFSGEPADPDAMHRPPVPPTAGLLRRRHLVLLGTGTAVLAVASLAAGLVVGGAEARTATFLALGLGQLGIALALRSHGPGRASYRLPLALVASSLLMLVPLVVPPLQDLLSTVALGPGQLGVALAAAVVPGLVVAVVRRVQRRR